MEKIIRAIVPVFHRVHSAETPWLQDDMAWFRERPTVSDRIRLALPEETDDPFVFVVLSYSEGEDFWVAGLKSPWPPTLVVELPWEKTQLSYLEDFAWAFENPEAAAEWRDDE